jgi:hypothetical protein
MPKKEKNCQKRKKMPKNAKKRKKLAKNLEPFRLNLPCSTSPNK